VSCCWGWGDSNRVVREEPLPQARLRGFLHLPSLGLRRQLIARRQRRPAIASSWRTSGTPARLPINP